MPSSCVNGENIRKRLQLGRYNGHHVGRTKFGWTNQKIREDSRVTKQKAGHHISQTYTLLLKEDKTVVSLLDESADQTEIIQLEYRQN